MGQNGQGNISCMYKGRWEIPVRICKETQKNEERITSYCGNDQKVLWHFINFTKVLSIILQAQHTTERIQFTMFPQYETSAVCQANTVVFLAILPMPTLLYTPCRLARNGYSLPCMPLQHGRMRKEWLGSYCDIMNTWSCVKFTKQLSIMYVKHILENFSSLHFLNIWSSYLHLRLCWLSRPGNIVRITTFSVSLQMVVILQGCDSRQATLKL